jgi:response regulator RpfG family c-di-GMP phosphodiesterase
VAYTWAAATCECVQCSGGGETVGWVIRSLQLTQEFHDHSAERWTRWVVVLASEIARACGIDDESVEMKGIYYAAALSGIGKTWVTATITAKDELLSEKDGAELHRPRNMPRGTCAKFIKF